MENTRLLALETDINNIDSAADLVFDLTYNEFQAKDQGKANSYLKGLTDIGARVVAIKMCCDNVRSTLSVLKDLEEAQK